MSVNQYEKLERNLDIYIARKNGETYRKLAIKYDLSQARIQDLVEKMEKKLESMPEIALIVAKKIKKELEEKGGE